MMCGILDLIAVAGFSSEVYEKVKKKKKERKKVKVVHVISQNVLPWPKTVREKTLHSNCD